jgi:Tol biopolymer transport system component
MSKGENAMTVKAKRKEGTLLPFPEGVRMNQKRLILGVCPIAGGLLVCLLLWTALASTPLAAQQVPGHLKIVFTSTQHAVCPTQPGSACDIILNDAELYVMNRNGSDQRRITFDNVFEYGARWSPDGTRIAFYSPGPGRFPQIFLLSANGVVQLTGTGPLTDTGAGAQFPHWSPDGKRIVFQTTPVVNGRFVYRNIFVINVDGTGLTKLTNSSTYQNRRPAWSPDGTRIAFSSNRDGNDEIYVMNADGSNPIRLTHDVHSNQAPDWSPDGSKIVFQSNRTGNLQIWVMNADGTGLMQLTNTQGCTRSGDPTWSPDGSKIAFASDRDFPTDDCNDLERGILQVFVMNADGTNQVSLTSLPGESGSPGWGWTKDEHAIVP